MNTTTLREEWNKHCQIFALDAKSTADWWLERLIDPDQLRERVEGMLGGDGKPTNDTMEIHLAIAYTDGFRSALSAVLSIISELGKK